VVAAKSGHWPQALPAHQALSFPCSYCRYSRTGGLGEDPPACDDHIKWEPLKVVDGGLAS
jgi:hypothetical protein